MRRKILLVDDSRIVRVIVRRSFRPYACELWEAGNGVEGLAVAAKGSPDLILLDLTMPVMGGLEMLARLKSDSQLKDIPVLLLAPAGSRDQVRRIGVVDCLMKPFDGHELIGKVGGLIELRPRPDPVVPVPSTLFPGVLYQSPYENTLSLRGAK